MHNQHITVLAKNYMASLHGEFAYLYYIVIPVLLVYKLSTSLSRSEIFLPSISGIRVVCVLSRALTAL